MRYLRQPLVREPLACRAKLVGSGRYEIVDHGSSNGIRINGVDLARGLLDARDLVELGDVVLKFIPEGQLYRPTPDESRQLAALLGVEVEGPPLLQSNEWVSSGSQCRKRHVGARSY